MERQLINLTSWLFFVCKWTGFTSYSITYTPTHPTKRNIFTKTKSSNYLNAVLVLVIVFFSLDFSDFFLNVDKVDMVFSLISSVLYMHYLTILILILNMKQTRVVTTFSKIVSFAVLTQKITNRNIDVAKVKKILKLYTLITYANLLIMWSANWFSVSNYARIDFIMWMIKDAVLNFSVVSGEILIFYYLVITINIVRQFNDFLKTESETEIRKIKVVFQSYADIKKNIQNISQIVVFFKTVYIVIELAATIYQIFIMGQIYENKYFSKLPLILVTGYWIFVLMFQAFSVICPFIFYYREVSLNNRFKIFE